MTTLAASVFASCSSPASTPSPAPAAVQAPSEASERKYLLERVDDAAVVQLYADGFPSLPLREKTLIFHLYRAAIAGRDIFYDQRHAQHLDMRDTLEAIVGLPPRQGSESGGSSADAPTLAEVLRYTKLFWLNTGPYNNLTARKFVLQCTPEAFAGVAHAAARAGAQFPLRPGETLDQLLARLRPMFFDPDVDPSITNKAPGGGKDILAASANNLYVGVTMKDLDDFAEAHALNSRLVKRDGRLVEEVYRIGGRYDAALREVVSHLEAAVPFATQPMAQALRALFEWYRTGEARDRRQYDIAWVQDKESLVDTINGFTEVTGCPGNEGRVGSARVLRQHGKDRGDQENCGGGAMVRGPDAVEPKYRKQGVQGITANAIDVVVETGDAGPVTPVGINLPNDQISERSTAASRCPCRTSAWRMTSRPTRVSQRVLRTPEEAARTDKWGSFAGELTTNMHEVIGHALQGVADRLKGNPQSALKEHFSALEEARADLVGLFLPTRSSSPWPSGRLPTRAKSSRPSMRAIRETPSCSFGGFAK